MHSNTSNNAGIEVMCIAVLPYHYPQCSNTMLDADLGRVCPGGGTDIKKKKMFKTLAFYVTYNLHIFIQIEGFGLLVGGAKSMNGILDLPCMST